MSSAKRRSALRSKSNDFQAASANIAAMVEGPTKRKWTLHDLQDLTPLTPPQTDMFHAFLAEQKHIAAVGFAGTGKTVVACYLALKALLDPRNDISHIIIVRSAVPSRAVGHLPGTIEEKQAIYESPYIDIFQFLLGKKTSYVDMKAAGLVTFAMTSFVRGLTWDNAIVIVDESQNMNWSELDSVITRLGENSRIILCGDTAYQCDLRHEQSGFVQALPIFREMEDFEIINFTEHDIVRSKFVKSWIVARSRQKV